MLHIIASRAQLGWPGLLRGLYGACAGVAGSSVDTSMGALPGISLPYSGEASPADEHHKRLSYPAGAIVTHLYECHSPFVDSAVRSADHCNGASCTTGFACMKLWTCSTFSRKTLCSNASFVQLHLFEPMLEKPAQLEPGSVRYVCTACACMSNSIQANSIWNVCIMSGTSA